MTDDTQTWPTGTPDAMGDMAAQLGPSSMCTSPTTDRPKRSISPEDGNRCKRIDSKGTPQKQRGAEMQLVTPQGEEDDVVARGLWVQRDLAPPPKTILDKRKQRAMPRTLG